MKLAILVLLVSLPAFTLDNHLGISLSGLKGSPQHRVDVAKQLGANWYRPAPVFLQGDAKCEDCEAARSGGLKITLVVRNTSEGKPTSAMTDIDGFKNKLRILLEREKPAMLVVEDEPEDTKNFSGTPDDYRAELVAACEVSRSLNIPCANGGLSSQDVAAVVIDQRLSVDPVDAAKFAITSEVVRAHSREGLNINILGRRVGKTGGYEDLPESGVPQTKKYAQDHALEIARTRQTIAAINEAHPDRLNFHWHELQPDNVPKVLDTLHELSKLDLMCDQMGQTEQRAFDVGEKIKNALDNYVWPTIWQGTDGKDGTIGLVDKDGKLRPNATPFQATAHQTP